jgi:signal transduction histidine kinase
LGTESGGVYLFNPVEKTFRQFFFQQKRPSANKIRDLHKDERGNVWVATYEGAFLINTSERIDKEITIADGLLHNVINTIYSDKLNKIWLVSEGPGISRYDDGKIKTFKFRGQINFNINCITEDRSGRLWLGTDGGGVFSFSKGKFRKVINKEEGLISNYCNAIICDKNNNLWVVHSDGLTKFTPSLREVIQFQKINGLSVKSIRSNSIVKSSNNNIYWGTEGKLVEYNPDLDALAVIKPILNIKGVELFFEKVDWTRLADSVYGDFNLPNQLVLNHNQNHLNFRFEATSFRADNILYRFKLQGFDQKWSLSTAQDFATYANLPPGEYTFMVSALSAGIWTKYQSFSFRISGPFWKTWWFILLVIIIIITIVGGVIYLRISNLKRKHNFLEEQKKVLMAEIGERKIAESKMIESEKKLMVVNEKLVKTNQELSTFIYRSSHDLKGPLMSIMGLTNLGKMETKEQYTSEYFSKIAHSATRLDGILKVLSTVTEIKEWNVSIQPIDFNMLTGEIMEELKGSYNVALIERKVQVNSEFCSDPTLITIIIRALLDNSFRYMNPHQKTPSIELNIFSFKEGIKINVQDNGIGISEEVIKRVFDMFFKGTEKSSGFGLGLYVVSNCVEKLNGTHSITSTEFQGTSVTVYLPNQKDNLSK